MSDDTPKPSDPTPTPTPTPTPPVAPPLDTKACLVPLAYETDRTEISAVYLGGDWRELQALLTNPAAFFEAAQGQWRQTGDLPNGEPFDWDLLRPSTVILKHVASTREDFFSIIGILPGEVVVPLLLKAFPPLATRSDQSFVDVDRIDSVDLKAISAAFNDDDRTSHGFFIAQFALDTHVLVIRYHTPAMMPSSVSRPRFTNASLIRFRDPDLPDLEAASVHFDIGRKPTGRAQFVMDYLVNHASVVQAALEAANQEYSEGSTYMRARGSALDVRKPPTKEVRPLCVPCTNYPTLVLEGLSLTSGGEQCAVCVEVNGTYIPPENPDEPGTFLIGTTVVKCYVEPGGS